MTSGAGDPGENPFAGQGAVLLDIGGDVGALVVTMPASMEGVEVEIRPVAAGAPDRHRHDGPAHHAHVAVVSRPVPGGLVPSLVYPDLVTGSYELSVKGTQDVHLVAHVEGGAVTSVRW